MNWIAWRSASGRPKVTRILEYSIIMSRARWAIPTGRAPCPRIRPSEIHFCASEKPPPTAPMTFAAGTRTLSKRICQGASPIIVGQFRSSTTPGLFKSTAKQVIPPRARFSGSVKAINWT